MADFEINRRLKKLIKDVYKTTPFAFSQKYSDNRGVKTSQVIRERNGLSNKLLEQILQAYPEINRVWLLTGEGNMLNYNSDNTDSNVLCEEQASYNREKKNSIIRYWIDIQATGGGLISFDDIRETYRKIDIKIPEFSDCTDAINLYGDSMAPQYKSGQIIILKEWKETFIDYGNAYLIITKNGNRMVKVLRTIKDDEKNVLCVSYNPDFDAFKLKKEDILRLYLVKGAIEKTTL